MTKSSSHPDESGDFFSCKGVSIPEFAHDGGNNERVAFLLGKIEGQAEVFQNKLSEMRMEKEKALQEKCALIAELSEIKAIWKEQTATWIQGGPGDQHSTSPSTEDLMAQVEQLTKDLDVAHSEKLFFQAECRKLEDELGIFCKQIGKLLAGQDSKARNLVFQLEEDLHLARQESHFCRLKISEMHAANQKLLTESQQAKKDLELALRNSHSYQATIQKLQAEKDELCDQVKKMTEANEKTSSEFQLPQCSNVVWKSSDSVIASRSKEISGGTYCIDKLNGVALSAGICIWKILVQKADGMRLGVVSKRHAEAGFDMHNLGDDEGSWGYSNFSDLWHAGKPYYNHPVSYGSGSTVTFTLDLTDRGRLYAQVDEGPSIEIFSSLKDRADSFVPAICLYNSSQVKFLGFEKFQVSLASTAN